MVEFVRKWLMDPVAGRLVASAIGIILLIALVRVTQRTVGRYVKDSTSRYRAGKGRVRIATASFEVLTAPELSVRLRRTEG